MSSDPTQDHQPDPSNNRSSDQASDGSKPTTPESNSELQQAMVERARQALDAVPETIGPYHVIERLGSGGMGEVFRANQREPIRRQVAVKLIKLGMDTRQVVARFEAERQALAMMDHPNIAKVFDGGTTADGRPYFVMEYVKGVPFTEYCDTAKLPLRERLKLFVPVCQAVQHAHQKGIVHRDLKPSNILICLYDGLPVPKVIDFGLAKALYQPLTDQSIYTTHGVMVGTPLYMSPEQAEQNNLDIDTRTDIYSLGVILYELLTGSTPLEREQLRAAAQHEVLRLIKEVDPPKPSTRLSGSASLPSVAAQRGIDPKQLSRSVSGDLDWIVMKALEKERSRRYDTAIGFAKDVERYLNDEAVEACPPSRGYLMRKFIGKHRVKVVAASVLMFTLVIGMLGTTWGLFRATIAESKAIQSENKTLQALKEVTKERDAKEIAREAEAKERQRADKQKEELEHQTYALGLQGSYNAIEKGDLKAAQQMLITLPERLRGWEWRWLMTETDNSLSTVQLPPNKEFLAHSRNGAYSVLQLDGKPNGPFELMDSYTGEILETIELPEVEEVMGVCVSVDGERVAILAVNEFAELDYQQLARSSVYIWSRAERRILWQKETSGAATGFVFTDSGNFSLSDDGKVISVCGINDSERWAAMEEGTATLNSHNSTFVLSTEALDVIVRSKSPNGKHLLSKISCSGDYLIIIESPNIIRYCKLFETTKETNEPFFDQINEIMLPDVLMIDEVVEVSSHRIACHFRREGWLIIDFQTGQVMKPGWDVAENGLHIWYEDGSCCASVVGSKLRYTRLSGAYVFEVGGIPSDVKSICCDDKNRRVCVYCSHSMLSYPLPSSQDLDTLASSRKTISKNGQVLASFSGDAGALRDIDSAQMTRYSKRYRYDNYPFIKENLGREVIDSFPNYEIAAFFWETGQTFGSFRLEEHPGSSITWAPDGCLLASLAKEDGIRKSTDRQIIRVHDGLTGHTVWSGTRVGVCEVVSLNHQALLVLSNKKLELINTSDGSCAFPLSELEIDEAALSGSEQLLATVTGSTVRIWNIHDWSLLSTWTIPQSKCIEACWALDDNRIIVRSDRSACFCSPSDGRVLLTTSLDSEAEFSVPLRGNSMILGHLCSDVPWRERWPKWQKTLGEEFSQTEIANAKVLLLAKINELTNESVGIVRSCREVEHQLLRDDSISATQKSHAYRMLWAAYRIIDEKKLEALVPSVEIDRDAMIAHFETLEDDSQTFFYRDIAASLIKRWVPTAEELNFESWDVVRKPAKELARYRKGLEWALKANELSPDDFAIMNTVGVAHFRVGEWEKCIASLEASKANAALKQEPDRSNDIFIAMAKAKLGQVDEAKKILDGVQQRVAPESVDSQPLSDEDRSFLQEAEELMRSLEGDAAKRR